MNSLQLYYPFKPFLTTQAWGVANPAYNHLGFDHHNGVDAYTGKTDWQGKIVSEFPVYCPGSGFVVESISFEPQGGGNQISLVSKEKIQVGDKECYARIYLCHAKKILVKAGDEPRLGELLMIADSTGFSTGIHCHIGLYRLGDKKQKLDTNNATGSYDPEPFFTKQYAIDLATISTLIKNNARYYAYLLGA